MLQVKVYSTNSCIWCRKAKEFFQKHNIEFEEIDVARDQNAAREMIEKSGQMGVPVIEIGDEIVVGFNREAISNLLNL
jgi:glutaredoxin-like YruB-family protein